MSYWIYIEDKNHGEQYCHNVTSNVSAMINASFDLGNFHWVDLLNGTQCNQVNLRVKKALKNMIYNKSKIDLLEASNGWGTYDQLLPFFINLSRSINDNPRCKILING